MTKEKIFKELIAEFAKSGSITDSKYAILLDKGKDLELSKDEVDLMIKMELADSSTGNSFNNEQDSENITDNNVVQFRSSVSRGGAILTPEWIIIDAHTVTYRKRNKMLINFDTITIPLSKISSVEVHSGLLGSEIKITSYGESEIIANKFTKSDAHEIKRLIQERQR